MKVIALFACILLALLGTATSWGYCGWINDTMCDCGGDFGNFCPRTSFPNGQFCNVCATTYDPYGCDCYYTD